ncbi:hypothetical protein LENED_001615 [Lentinula edodes]|uniref:Uncharacterized protein n=1 Tax=Lentinula edodes TaxID=5353 RepID=A0A1Q3DYX7_LENED|nr:hypothetical protein LENED_001615 [Lentinula edodes]
MWIPAGWLPWERPYVTWEKQTDFLGSSEYGHRTTTGLIRPHRCFCHRVLRRSLKNVIMSDHSNQRMHRKFKEIHWNNGVNDCEGYMPVWAWAFKGILSSPSISSKRTTQTTRNSTPRSSEPASTPFNLSMALGYICRQAESSDEEVMC